MVFILQEAEESVTPLLIFEVCLNAGSYRGEPMGLLSIHVFLHALESFYGITIHEKCEIACDNLGALKKSKERRKKVPSGGKHADIIGECCGKSTTVCVGIVPTGMSMVIKTNAKSGWT